MERNTKEPMMLTQIEGTPKAPGQWTMVTAECKDKFPIVLACPKCGRLNTVSSKTHLVTISPIGGLTLSPRFICARCNWAGSIKNGNY